MTAALCTGFLMGSIAANVAAIALEVRRIRLLDRLLADLDSVSEAELARSDDLVVSFTLAQLVLFLISAVLFMWWFQVTYRALHRTSTGGLRHSPGWALGAWLVPFLNLVRPVQMVADAWRAASWKPAGPPTPRLVAAWWTLWLLVNVSTGVAAGLDADTLSAVRSATQFAVLGDALFVVAGILAVMVVVGLTGRIVQRIAAEA